MKKKIISSIFGLSLLASCAHKTPEEKQEWLLSKAKTELDLSHEQLSRLKTAMTDLGDREGKNHKAEFKKYFSENGFEEKNAQNYLNSEFIKMQELSSKFVKNIGEFYNSLDTNQKSKFLALYDEYSKNNHRRRHRNR